MSMKTRQNPFHDKFQWHIQTIWETGMPVWVLKKILSKIPFFICISTKKCVEVAISDFTMHLITLNWLRIQKYRRKRKAIRQRGQSKQGLIKTLIWALVELCQIKRGKFQNLDAPKTPLLMHFFS